uniref:ACYPI000248 protein n=1 Tax=Acyrthosiphon pisum TaxID=7029 RepID=C4WRJ9_ACYPI|nr:ACYPI000248 [Acyrthosiphon pisum]
MKDKYKTVNFSTLRRQSHAKTRTPLKIPIKMAPPSYSDLGKAARDVFNTGYVFDVLKLDLKTNQNVEIKAGGTQHLVSGAVNANLETKYVINKSKYLFTLVEKWNTNDVMTTEASISGLLPGVNLQLMVHLTARNKLRL